MRSKVACAARPKAPALGLYPVWRFRLRSPKLALWKKTQSWRFRLRKNRCEHVEVEFGVEGEALEQGVDAAAGFVDDGLIELVLDLGFGALVLTLGLGVGHG